MAHKTLESMVEVAQNNGESKRGAWHVTVERVSAGSTYDFGYKKEEVVHNFLNVYHYGTKILTLGWEQAGWRNVSDVVVTHVYGISRSDADAINSVLEYFGVRGERYTYRPVNGGFMRVG